VIALRAIAFMDASGTLVLKLRNRLSATRRFVAGIFSLGIAARMTIALASVAILAIAANIVGEKTVSFVRTYTRDARTLPVSRIARRAAPPTSVAPTVNVRSKELALAIDRFQHASEMRAQSDSALNAREYLGAKSALLKTDSAQLTNVPTRRSNMAGLAWDIDLFIKHGQSMVAVSDERRKARADYLLSLEALNTGMQRAMDRAWKILGRILAPQSLLQLREELDAIRRNSEALRSEDLPSPPDIDGLIAGENAFQETLTAHRAGFVKSEGAGWVEQTQENLSLLVAQRKQQVLLRVQQDEFNRNLAQQRSALSAAAASAFAAEDRIARQTTALPATAFAEDPLQSYPSIASVVPITDSVVTTETAPDRDARSTMAYVTIFTLLVTGVVCMLTVRSVVVPVRRFLDATTKLGRGNHRVHVTPGGIRELDTLANAFNEMAQQLAEERLRIRHQNESLEAKVVERTHQLQKLAEEDPLTSLPNRRRLQALLSDALDHATRQARCVGVYFVDIDNFKSFNDSLGHAFGDRVLMSVANRLEELVDGRGFVARLGGDEFTVVYGDAPSADAIRELGLSIVSAFQPLLLVDGREFSVSVSVGASIFPEHEAAAEGLLRAADSALFRAKEAGRSQLVVFTSELIETAAVRFATEQGLRRAIDRREFVLMYQPEVSLKTFKVELVEALLRWQRPDGHLAYPGEFLAVAEQSSLASEINEWVLREAVLDASRWHHGGWPDVRVAINVSPRQLLDRRFTERLLLLLNEHRLPAGCIELELTETVLQTGQLTIDTLRVLRSHGIGIALDDFGTGYSSITSLQELPLSRVKLDRSLIATIDTSERAPVITHAIIELCSGLGLEVTAEGIERPAQLAWLLNQPPMLLQGFLLSRALPFAEISNVRAFMPQTIQDLVLSQPGAEPVPLKTSALRDHPGTVRATEAAVRAPRRRPVS
jgi:diguanylate cyclase (GGDEF)-like protein